MKKIIGFTIVFLGIIIGEPTRVVGVETTSVEYNASSSYEVSIPAKVKVSNDEKTKMEVGVKNINISPIQAIEINVVSGVADNGDITMEREHGEPTQNLVTTLSVLETGNMDEAKLVTAKDNQIFCVYGNDIQNPGIYSKFQTLIISEPTGQKYAGKYSAKVVFQATLSDSYQN